MQTAMVHLAANLPDSVTQELEVHAANVQIAPKAPPPEALQNVHTAAAYVKETGRRLFSKPSCESRYVVAVSRRQHAEIQENLK
jgi:hypothetical protein